MPMNTTIYVHRELSAAYSAYTSECKEKFNPKGFRMFPSNYEYISNGERVIHTSPCNWDKTRKYEGDHVVVKLVDCMLTEVERLLITRTHIIL